VASPAPESAHEMKVMSTGDLTVVGQLAIEPGAGVGPVAFGGGFGDGK
jgi:hypothetical protein